MIICGCSILGRLGDIVDDEEFDGSSAFRKFQTKLLFEGGQ